MGNKYARLIIQVGLLFTPLRIAKAHVSPYVSPLMVTHKSLLSHFLISHFRRQTESSHNATAMFRCQALLIRQTECDPRQGKELSRRLSNFHASSSNYYNSEMYSSTASVRNHEGFVIFIAHFVGLVRNVKNACCKSTVKCKTVPA